MTSSLLAALVLAAAPPERLAVLSVAEPPGPAPELVELTHQLRAACRDRHAGVIEVAELRARLLGEGSSSTLPDLERAYAGAMATYQAGEYEGTVRTLRAVIDDLERLPESPEAYAQWLRATLRLAHAELTLGHAREYKEALERVAAVDPRHAPDPDQFSPTFRRAFDGARARVAARPKRRVSVRVAGVPSASVFLDGKPVGAAPVALDLPAGRYRVGAAAGGLRVPSAWVTVADEPRAVVLDFSVAGALRVDAGPGLASPEAARAGLVVTAGGWLAADRVLAASVAREDRASFLVGSLYDVRRGAMVRQGRVRMLAGAVPAPAVGALAAFLLTGQPSQEVLGVEAPPPVVADAMPAARAAPGPAAAPSVPRALDLRTPALPAKASPVAAAPAPRAWKKPAAYGSAGLAVVLGAVALQQGLAARGASSDAAALVRGDGTVTDPARYGDLVASADSARRNAWIGAAGAAVFTATAATLGYLVFTEAGAPAVRF